ncbi:P-loop containing nucleoside triphosphate hydrolase protein [Crassisporium funariophilum]|nr:P-loop containing nucleoside triphosphate hydrolase protein [Crassisporium funariophilum]
MLSYSMQTSSFSHYPKTLCTRTAFKKWFHQSASAEAYPQKPGRSKLANIEPTELAPRQRAPSVSRFTREDVPHTGRTPVQRSHDAPYTRSHDARSPRDARTFRDKERPQNGRGGYVARGRGTGRGSGRTFGVGRPSFSDGRQSFGNVRREGDARPPQQLERDREQGPGSSRWDGPGLKRADGSHGSGAGEKTWSRPPRHSSDSHSGPHAQPNHGPSSYSSSRYEENSHSSGPHDAQNAPVPRPRPRSTPEEAPLADEFYHPSSPVSTALRTETRAIQEKTAETTPSEAFGAQFTSPPLLPGLLASLQELLGPSARPTPIQALSLKYLLENPDLSSQGEIVDSAPGWRQFLLASETGSGKSIAYLLPMLQHLKLSEASTPADRQQTQRRAYNPRGLILAPTHELARQLSGFAKSLLHHAKLRVMCASQANEKSTVKKRDSTASQMALRFAETAGGEGGEFKVGKTGWPVDLVVGTPMKLLEMVRGRGWDRREMTPEEEEREMSEREEGEEEHQRKARRGRDKMLGFGKWRSRPELGLAGVEWVVVDEADVLFDPDFQETTRTLLADIAAARGMHIPITPLPALSAPSFPSSLSHPPSTHTAPTPAFATPSTPTTPIQYPFHLLLTSATIPKSLNTYLSTYHPALTRLASPLLHHLPKGLQTEYVNWTGGNKFADIERRIRRVWAEDASAGAYTGGGGGLSKVLVFCNRSSKVVEFSAYLEERGIKNVAMTSRSEHRGRGSNRHLDGFLRTRNTDTLPRPSPTANTDPKTHPHVMITTSLLSRGLDFAPSIKHVFIVDEPRNMVDFLHRAGRSGRAGERGRVVVFGKMRGRGSEAGRAVRKRVGGVVAGGERARL